MNSNGSVEPENYLPEYLYAQLSSKKVSLNNSDQSIAIIGAGACGLAAALKLADLGKRVTIFEQASEVGGLTGDDTVGYSSLERIYHHQFVSDSHITKLLERFGRLLELKWYSPKNALFQKGRLYPFTTPLDLLAFSAMPVISRIRTGLLIFMSRYIKDPYKLDRLTAKKWLIRFGGVRAYECLWKPLLRSKFDLDADMISGTWIWNKFKLRGSSRAKSIARESLGYPDGGFNLLLKDMAKAVQAGGGRVLLNSKVNGLSRQKDGTFLLSAMVDTRIVEELFTHVIYTAAPETLSTLSPGSVKNDAAKYKANLCLRLSLSKSLSNWYWITVADESMPFVVVVEHTKLTGTEPYGSHQVYLSRYLDIKDELWQAEDSRVIASFLMALPRIFPDFDEGWVLSTDLTRSKYAQPVPLVGSGSKLLPLSHDLPGLFLASMAQVWPEDRGLNYAIRLGEEVAYKLVKSI